MDPHKELEMIRKYLTKYPYVIIHYEETHPLFEYFTNEFFERSKGELQDLCDMTEAYLDEVQDMPGMILSILFIRQSEDPEEPYWGAFAQSTLYDGKEYHIHTICANKGYGSILLKDIEKRAKSWGSSFITLDSLEVATGFYEKMGYDYTGENSGYTTIFPMKKMLGGSRRGRKGGGKGGRKNHKRHTCFKAPATPKRPYL